MGKTKEGFEIQKKYAPELLEYPASSLYLEMPYSARRPLSKAPPLDINR